MKYKINKITIFDLIKNKTKVWQEFKIEELNEINCYNYD